MENKRPAQSIWLKVGLLLTLALVAVPVLVAAQVAEQHLPVEGHLTVALGLAVVGALLGITGK